MSQIASRRRPVNKKASSKAFRQATTRTKGANVSGAPMRGGIRL